jgi:hypothetical protein
MSGLGYLAVHEQAEGSDKYEGTMTSGSFIEIIDESISPSNEEKKLDDTVGSRLVTKSFVGPFSVGGDFSMYVEPENCGALFKWLLGGYEVEEVVTGSVYKHTFTVGESLDLFTIEKGIGKVSTARIYGCKMDSGEFTVDAGEALKASFGVVGSNLELVDRTEPIFSPLIPFLASKMTLTKGSKTSDTDTGTVAYVTSFSNSISNSLVDDFYVLGRRSIKEIQEGLVTIEGSFDAAFVSDEDFRMFLGAADATEPMDELADVVLDLMFTGSVIEGTEEKYTLHFSFPKVHYSTIDANISGKDKIIESVSFTAVGTGSFVELQNTVETYEI